jgi:hypothetical protein
MKMSYIGHLLNDNLLRLHLLAEVARNSLTEVRLMKWNLPPYGEQIKNIITACCYAR